MKLAFIVACGLLLALPPFGTAAVEVVAPRKSSPIIRLKILLGGKPQSGAKIEIYKYQLGPGQETKPRFSLFSDEQGIAVPPELAPGSYHIVASAEKDLHVDVYLDVVSEAPVKTSEFSMELVASPYPTVASPYATREQLVEKAESGLSVDRVQEFRGTIFDPSGAGIAGASVEVARAGTRGTGGIASLKSDSRGEFFAALPEGRYVAVIAAPGFRTLYLPFDVSSDGSKDFKVILRLGSTT